jgi:CRP-like cAMP-binding protein
MVKPATARGPREAAVDTRNYVLNAMRLEDLHALEPHLQDAPVVSGQILYEPGYPVDWVYFPSTAVLSVVTVMADGRTVESDTVGYESAVGVLCALGASASVSRTFTQIGGSTIRLSASRLRHRAEESASLRRLLIRYAQANLAQAHQSVACNALHDLTQRLCRWLLMSHDRTGGDEVRLTQQYLATMLGVQRTTVTEALRELASAGLIRQQRGAIHVLDRARMEAETCECYDAVRSSLQQLIGADPSIEIPTASVPGRRPQASDSVMAE